MRLATALWPFLHIALCGGAPATRATRAAAPVAAPAAPVAAPPPLPDAGVVALPQDEILDPSEMANKATTDVTKNGYRDIVTDFCVWLYDSDDELTLAADARASFNEIDAQHDDTTTKGKKARSDAIRQQVKEWLIVDEKEQAGSAAQHCLIDFGRYKPETVVRYMCSRRKVSTNQETGQKEERNLGKSRYSVMRTALMTYLTGLYDHDWTAKQLKYMAQALKGIGKVTAAATQNKGRQKDMEPGKKAMSFELFEKTNIWLIEQGDRSAVFARAYLCKTWTLACRSDSTQSIKTADLQWSGDASGVVFAHQKNDQDGSRARKPRHSYFNPIKWWMCTELALFEYLVIFPDIVADTSRGAKLFRGGGEEKAASARFWSVLKKLYQEHADELDEMGYHVSDLGTHSVRKGAITYLTSGTTDGPSSIAACIRGGWSMGRMLNVYCLYERAGDHLCGRILSGLPTLSPDFAVLPPDFYVLKAPGESDEARANREAGVERAINDGIAQVFGQLSLPTNLRRFARIGLAQALHCRDEMRSRLPAGAAVLAAPYHRLASFDAIKRCVLIRHPWDDGDKYWGSVTGIPSHVVVIGKQQQTYDLIKELPAQIRDIISKELDDRAYGGTLSINRMSQLFDTSVNTAMAPMQAQMNTMQNLLAAMASRGVGDAMLPSNTPEADPDLQRYGGWKWVQSRWRRVPAAFRFPDSTPDNLLEQWFIGSEILQVPPLHMLDINDVIWQIRGDKKLRDARAMVKAVVDEAKRKNIWGDGDHTATELRQIYRQCREDIGITGNVTNSWQTALKKVRRKNPSSATGRRRGRGGARKRSRAVDNAGRLDCNPHHRMRTRTHGERTLAAGLNAAAAPVATGQVTMRQAQGESFVDSVVGVQDV